MKTCNSHAPSRSLRMILLKALPSLPRERGPETAERTSVHLLKALGRLLRVPEHQTSWMENDGVDRDPRDNPSTI